MNSYLVIICLIIVVGVILKIRKDEINQRKRFFHMQKFEQYMVLLEYVMKKAYEIIHKDRIMIYSLEATTLGEGEYNAALKDFINLTIRFLGSNLKEEFIEFFGTEETLLFNIAEYFSTNYENDEVRKGATDKLMENDTPEEVPEIDFSRHTF
jgi:hypothetical protein